MDKKRVVFLHSRKTTFFICEDTQTAIIREFGIKFNESLTFIDFTKVTILIIRTLQTLKASTLSKRRSERPAE